VYPIVVALDADYSKALEIARELAGLVAGFKIGWDLILERGISIVGEFSKLGPIVVDLKIADVPHISERIAKKLISAGACCIIAHGFLYPSSLRGDEVYALIKMTVPTFYDRIWQELLDSLKDVRGYVVPANDPRAIEEIRRREGCSKRIISPGIGAQGGKPGDALKAGADLEIVGRYVLENLSNLSSWEGARGACHQSL